MKSKPIIIVTGNENTIFFEIFFKCLKLKKYKSPLILIGDLNILKKKMDRYKFKKKINLLNINNLGKTNLNNNNLLLQTADIKSQTTNELDIAIVSATDPNIIRSITKDGILYILQTQILIM